MNKELRKSIDEEQLENVTGGGGGNNYVVYKKVTNPIVNKSKRK